MFHMEIYQCSARDNNVAMNGPLTAILCGLIGAEGSCDLGPALPLADLYFVTNTKRFAI